MPGQKITFKTKIALKTFGSAMAYFDFKPVVPNRGGIPPQGGIS